MTAALSEWVKCYWIKFILNCTESKWVASSVTLVCTESQTTHEPLASLSLLWFQEILEIKFGIFFFFFFMRSWPFVSQSIRRHDFDCWNILGIIQFLVSVHVCVRTVVCMFFPLRAISEGQSVSNFEPNMSQRVWHGTCLFCFCKIEFCCKMHMREFCTEVTIVP